MFIHNPRQIFGCEDCGKAWSMERLDDWGNSTQMPPEQFKFPDVFDR
jgi:hypothetical protein